LTQLIGAKTPIFGAQFCVGIASLAGCSLVSFFLCFGAQFWGGAFASLAAARVLFLCAEAGKDFLLKS